MKRNNRNKLQELDIDPIIRPLVSKLWKHQYITVDSCQGGGIPHNNEAYISIRENSGDGWLERNASMYGLKRQINSECCVLEIEDPYCGGCGAGTNGIVTYRGELHTRANRKNLLV